MKKSTRMIIWCAVVLVLLIVLILDMGVGPYSSGPAVRDLKEDLKELHGEPYSGRKVEGGIESMEFFVDPDTFFMTDYGWRKFFGVDYKYTCRVVYTVTSQDGEPVSVRTITYDGIDPMGHDEGEMKAYVDSGNSLETLRWAEPQTE